MAVIRSCFTFVLGASFGIYMARNHKLPQARRLPCMARQYQDQYSNKHSLEELEDSAHLPTAPAKEDFAGEFLRPTPPHFSRGSYSSQIIHLFMKEIPKLESGRRSPTSNLLEVGDSSMNKGGGDYRLDRLEVLMEKLIEQMTMLKSSTTRAES